MSLATDNSHKSKAFLYDVKPNMSEMTNYNNSYNVALTKERYNSRYTPALSSKTLVYDQSRQTPLPVIFGTKFVRYIDPTVIHRPAGMDGINSTRMTGQPLFPQPQRGVYYPQNV